MNLTQQHLRWFRLRRSGLVEPFATAEEAASRLTGVQAQILPAAALSLWNRARDLTHARFNHLLHQKRALVKLWGQRRTLHLYPSAEWPLIHGALVAERGWWERQAGQARHLHALLSTVEAMLRERDSLGRSDLREAGLPLDDWHLSPWGGIFFYLVHHGHACHAPQQGGEARLVHREKWLPHLLWNPPSSDEANREIARRYFATYGPATLKDFAYWRGATMASSRGWLTGLDLVELDIDGQTLLALRSDLQPLNEMPPEREAWPVRMLYRFDPLLLGLKDKTWIVDSEHYKRVWRPAGHIEGTIIEHGRLVATWRYDRKSSGLLITLSPFAPLPAHVRAAVETHAQGVADFFDLPLLEIR
jgi:hypothetical protein